MHVSAEKTRRQTWGDDNIGNSFFRSLNQGEGQQASNKPLESRKLGEEWKRTASGAGEVAQWLGVLVALAEAMRSVQGPMPRLITTISPVSGDLSPSSDLQACMLHTYTQADEGKHK